MLVLYEVTDPPAWLDISFALFEGWQRFDDGVRTDSPLLSRDAWVSLLKARGFDEVQPWPGPGSEAEILGAHVIVARTSLEGTRAGQIAAGRQKQSQPEPASEADRSAHHELIFRLEQAAPDERHELLVAYARAHVMRALGRHENEPVERRHRLMDLGVDSLMAVELRNRLSEGLPLLRPLPATLIFDYPTVEAIAARLSKLLPETAVEPLEETDIDSEEADRSEDSVRDMSDEEVEQLLLKRLESL
jgi:hypothetical protein